MLHHIKVLNILNAIEFSGAEVMLKIAGPRFAQNGIGLHVLSTGEDVGGYAGELANAGYAVYHIPFRKSLSYFLDYYRLIREHHFDIVHIHPERAFFWHALLAKIAGVRTIVRTVHNVFLFSGYLRFKRTLQRWISNHVLGLQFVSVGPSVAQVEREVFHNRTRLIRNWLDQARFKPARDNQERRELRLKYGLPPAAVILLSIGACTAQKNHNAIICALAKIQSSSDNVIYLHVGRGPLLEEEMKTVKSMGLSDRVRFVPQTLFVRDMLVLSDIFVMSSTREGLSISSIEAMSCGLPVVAYDVYGLRDVVENGNNGFLVKPNPDDLAIGTQKLVSSAEMRREMGIAARRSVLKNFDMQRSVGSLLKLYRAESAG
jgi:glycosyltransferase involved in cell wall biosynthesis